MGGAARRRPRSPLRGAAAIAAERQLGLGRELVVRLQEPGSKARALIVVSSSGRTPVAIEAAVEAREMGLLTIGVTGDSGGNLLTAHLDHALLTGVSRGDASVRIGDQMMSPQSTVAGVVLLHCLFADTEALRSRAACSSRSTSTMARPATERSSSAIRT